MHENCHKPLMFRCALNRCCHFCLLVFQWLVCRLVPPSDVGCTWYQLRSRHREQGRKTSTKERHSSSNTKSSFSVIFFFKLVSPPLYFSLFVILDFIHNTSLYLLFVKPRNEISSCAVLMVNVKQCLCSIGRKCF